MTEFAELDPLGSTKSGLKRNLEPQALSGGCSHSIGATTSAAMSGSTGAEIAHINRVELCNRKGRWSCYVS